MGNDGLPLRYDEQQPHDLKGYMCRSKLNESTLLTIKCLKLKKALEVNVVRKEVQTKGIKLWSSFTISMLFKEGCECL